MPRVSTIETLPADILQQLQALLRDPRVNQLQATARINKVLADEGCSDETGEPVQVTKSSVNRYDIKMRAVGERLQNSRNMAEMWIAKLGAAPQGQVGNLVNEILRTLSFEVSLLLTEGELNAEALPGVVSCLKDLSLATMRLEKASSENVKREKEIREQAAIDAADVADKTLTQQGMSRASIDVIKAEILGLAS